MKRILLAVVVLIVAALLFFQFSRKGPAQKFQPAALVPEDSVALFELPDPQASVTRWAGTSIGQILAEPEIKTFLIRPLSQLPKGGKWSGSAPEMLKLKPENLFVAVTSVKETVPVVIGGFRFTGKKEDLDAALREAKAAVQKNHPAGKGDLVKHGSFTIETFEDKNFVLCATFTGNCYLISNNLAQLKSSLDALSGKPSGQTLSQSPIFRDTLKELPSTVETRVFIRPGALFDKLEPLLLASGQKINRDDLAKARALNAIAATTSFDGENLRDTILLMGTDSKSQETLRQPLLPLASPNTVFLYSGLIDCPSKFAVPEIGRDPLGVFDWLGKILPALENQGLGMDRLKNALGSELSILIDWPQSEFQPSLLGAIEVRDRPLVSKILNALAANPLSGLVVARESTADAEFFSVKTAGRLNVTPGIALLKERVLFAADQRRLRAIAAGIMPKTGTLEASPTFQAALKQTGKADIAFAYLDTRVCFERAYGFGRPALALSAGLMPNVRKYIDPQALPEINTVAKHLGPAALSQRRIPGGVRIESTGPLTLNQIVCAGLTGSLLSAARGYFAQ